MQRGQCARLVALGVVILARPDCPDESRQSGQAHDDGDRDKNHKDIHGRRTAFKVTIRDDPDIASAAINGVAWPRTAIGTAITL